MKIYGGFVWNIEFDRPVVKPEETEDRKRALKWFRDLDLNNRCILLSKYQSDNRLTLLQIKKHHVEDMWRKNKNK